MMMEEEPVPQLPQQQPTSLPAIVATVALAIVLKSTQEEIAMDIEHLETQPLDSGSKLAPILLILMPPVLLPIYRLNVV